MIVANSFYITSTSYTDQDFHSYYGEGSFYTASIFVLLQIFTVYYMLFWLFYLYFTRAVKEEGYSKFLLAIGVFLLMLSYKNMKNDCAKCSALIFILALYGFGAFTLAIAFSSKIHSINFSIQFGGSLIMAIGEFILGL